MRNLGIAITPGGRLRVIDDPEADSGLSEASSSALVDSFERSNAHGLLCLVSHRAGEKLPPGLVYWRAFAGKFFEEVCHRGESGFATWAQISPPAEAELGRRVAEAPPMRGLEFLTPPLLENLWQELRDLVVAEAARHADGPAGFLHDVNPIWHLVGRVTFHLAENKRDPQRPFAFLATYTHGVSQKSQLRHLPLAEALRTYAGARDLAKLEALLTPVRRAGEASEVTRALLTSKKLFAPQPWTIREAYRFLKESERIEAAGVVVRLPDWWSARQPPRPQVAVRIGDQPRNRLGLGGLMDFHVGLALDGEELTEAEVRVLLKETEGLVLLRGKWVEVDRERLQQALDHWNALQADHPQGLDFIQGMRLLSGARLGEADTEDAETQAWAQVTAGRWLQETLEQMRRPDQVDSCRPGLDLQATLRPYQVEGVKWLWFMTGLNLGGCLADDMGLGKTIQVIDLLLQRKRSLPANSRQPNLLIVPASLIGNWRQELTRFAPSLSVRILHSSAGDTAGLACIAADPERELAGVDLTITTYGSVRRQPWLERVAWSLVILDEAQAIKNASAAQTKAVKKLKAGGRLVLTGTPVENHLGDLWSIFDFCCPGLLGSSGQFKQYVKRLNQQQDAQAFGGLRRLVRPYILRRLKTDPAVVPDLPAKTEMAIVCGLSKKQAVLYQRVLDDLERKLETAEGIARRGLVLTTLMQLKQICNHPAQYVPNLPYEPAQSGKFERLRLLCEPIAERQEKVLVFTQFQALTEPLADYLATLFGRQGLVLHGGTPVGKRPELVRRFQEEQGPPFFVISLKAGGSGLNLTAASHVIHFDRWWNPAVENQATDRAFRIGQKRNVLVHKFVCQGTVEERIDAMIRDKRAVADQVLGGDAETPLTEMSDAELLAFVALDVTRATADE